MNISERGLNLIKSYEGCRLSSYKCPSNKWTIGWGRTSGVYEGMVITQAQADQFLFEDVQRFVNAVNQYQSRFNFNQAEFDSLTSFTYNCGEGSLAAVMSCCNTKLFTSGASSSNNTTVAANNNCSSYHENGEFFFNTKVRIRTAPSLDVSTIATDIQEPFYDPGESVVYHTVHLNKEGYNWIQYNRTNGTQGYCAVRDLSTGERFGHAI